MVKPRVHVTINNMLYGFLTLQLDWMPPNSLVCWVVFPFGALWGFSVVSLRRRTFASSRFWENEILLFCLCMIRPGASGRYCGDPVSIVSDRVRQHHSWTMRVTYLYLTTIYHINTESNSSVRKLWRADGTIIKVLPVSCPLRTRQVMLKSYHSYQAPLDTMSSGAFTDAKRRQETLKSESETTWRDSLKRLSMLSVTYLATLQNFISLETLSGRSETFFY